MDARVLCTSGGRYLSLPAMYPGKRRGTLADWTGRFSPVRAYGAALCSQHGYTLVAASFVQHVRIRVWHPPATQPFRATMPVPSADAVHLPARRPSNALD